MLRVSFVTLAALLGATGGAVAAPDCEDHGPGLHITFGFSVGSPYTDEEQEVFDKMHLRQSGVVARETKRTAGDCIEAWVPDGQGGFDTEYYDPRTFERKTFDSNSFRLQLD